MSNVSDQLERENARTNESGQDSQAQKNQAPDKPVGTSNLNTIEHISLLTLLENIISKLSHLEKEITTNTKTARFSIKDIVNVIFNGWQFFALLILVLFYQPLYNSLSSVSYKLREANEISIAGISLKSTIKDIAANKGFNKLGETIPNLSSDAIELLLSAPKYVDSLVSFTNSAEPEYYSSINFPSADFINTAQELLELDLIQVSGGLGKPESLNAQALGDLIENIKKTFPGTAESRGNRAEVGWIPRQKLKRDFKPNISMTWKLSIEGTQAVDVILKAVSAQLEQDAKISD